MAIRPVSIVPNRDRRAGANVPEPIASTEREGTPIGDAYAMGVWGQVKDAFEAEADAWQQLDPDWRVQDNIPAGYEEYAAQGAFDQALNPAMVETIRRNIDDNLERAARRAEDGVGNTLVADLFAGVLSPETLAPGARLLGVGFKAGVVKGAITVGGLGAGSEIVRTSLDPTATAEEGMIGAGASLVLGGTVGGIAGRIGARAAVGAGRPATRSVVPARMPLPVPEGFRPTSRFGKRKAPWTKRGRGSSQHQGVDLPTPEGTPVTAQGTATVVKVTPASSGYGISVTLDFGNGVGTKVAHLSEASVKEGDVVRKGQVYAKTGNTGKSTGPHLHYEVTVGGKRVDPLSDEAFELVGEPRNPVDAVNAIEGARVAPSVDIDGRGVPVVVGSTGNGAGAKFVRGRVAEDIIEDEIADVARAAEPADGTRTLPSDEPDQPRFIQLGAEKGMPVADLNRIVAQIAEEEGLAGAQAKARGKALKTEVRAYFKLDPVKVAPLERDEIFNRLMTRALAAEDRGDEQAATALYAEAERYAPSDRTPAVDPDTGLSNRPALADEADGLIAQRDRARGRNAEVQRKENIPGAGMTRDQLRAAMRETPDQPDNLPFNLHGEGDGVDMDGDHIVIDVDLLTASYPSKPWTEVNVEGVTPLADDAFESVEEWIAFARDHEVEHTLNPRREGESLADYENRINARAYEMTLASRLEQSNDNWLERAIVYPTPRGQIERLISDPGALIRTAIMDLADDFAIQTLRHRQGGTATVGGSVFQRTEMWIARLGPVVKAMDVHYLKRIGKNPDVPAAVRLSMLAAAKLPGKRKGLAAKGLPTMEEFREEVAAAIVGRGETTAEARAVASVFNKVMQDVEAEARELGLFQSTKGLQARAARARSLADRYDRLADQLDGDELSVTMREGAEQLRTEASEFDELAAEPVMPWREPNYFRRHWDVSAIENNKAAFLEKLRQGYARVGHGNPEMAAEGAYSRIVDDPSDELHAPGSPSALHHRTVPLTNDEAFEFIVKDPELILHIYLKRMGAAIEMTRTFGDPYALGTVKELRADMVARGVPREKIEDALQIFEDMRDRIAGGFHGAGPLSWSNRTVRAIKNTVSTVLLGKVIKSQVGDVARSIMSQGLGLRRMGNIEGTKGVMSGFIAGVAGELDFHGAGKMSNLAGEAMEYATARTAARMVEDDTAIMVTNDNWFAKAMAKAQFPFFVLNGMIPFTVIMKDTVAAVAAHNVIEEARLVAAALREGSAVDQRIAARLRSLGIDEQDAMIIADMPTERGPKSGLHLANINAWSAAGERGERAAMLLRAAVNGEVRKAVTTPGPLDRPAIFDGVFHDRKGRTAALEAVKVAERKVENAHQTLRRMGRRPNDDPDKQAALEAYREAKGELTLAERGTGLAGRKERPFASLPFQVQSFAMASASKLVRNLAGNRERAKIQGIAALIAGGMISTYWKNPQALDDPEQFLYEAFENSGVGAWFTSIGGNVDTALNGFGAGAILPGNEFDEDGERVSDEIGGAVPAAGIAAQLIEAFVRADLEDDERRATIRRNIPFANLIWFDWMLDKLDRQLSEEGEREAGDFDDDGIELDVPAGDGDEPALLGRYAAERQDLRNAPAAETVAVLEALPDAGLDELPRPPRVSTIKKQKAGIKAKRKPKPVRPAIL